jgi:hypothetical protein
MHLLSNSSFLGGVLFFCKRFFFQNAEKTPALTHKAVATNMQEYQAA